MTAARTRSSPTRDSAFAPAISGARIASPPRTNRDAASSRVRFSRCWPASPASAVTIDTSLALDCEPWLTAAFCVGQQRVPQVGRVMNWHVIREAGDREREIADVQTQLFRHRDQGRVQTLGPLCSRPTDSPAALPRTCLKVPAWT